MAPREAQLPGTRPNRRYPVDTTTIAEIMERDIARLKSARPQLASRIERAEHILVTQLSTANGSRPVKVRVHADGSRSYSVRSGSKLCRFYLVDQRSWECECPDHRRRQAACKHALACWVLERAYRPSPVSGLEHVSGVATRVLVDTAASEAASEGVCSGCGGHFAGRDLVELTEDNHDNLTYFHGDVVCFSCAAEVGAA
jgi:hypothetical protein